MLYETYRPTTPDDLVGSTQQQAAKSLLDPGHNPKLVLLTGDTGIGKTTIAMMYADKIAGPGNWEYINCRDIGVADIRDKLAEAGPTLFGKGGYRCIFLDELDVLTQAGQQRLLGIESLGNDGYLYIIAATKNPAGLRVDLRHRFLEYELKRPTPSEASTYALRVIAGEGRPIDEQDENFKAALKKAIKETNGDLRLLSNLIKKILDGIYTFSIEEEQRHDDMFKLIAFPNRPDVAAVATNLNEDLNYFGLCKQLAAYALNKMKKGDMSKLDMFAIFGYPTDNEIDFMLKVVELSKR